MYEPQISEYSERSARWVGSRSLTVKRLSFDELLAKVRATNPDSTPGGDYREVRSTASVAVNLGRENTVFVKSLQRRDPRRTVGRRTIFMRDVVDWHRWLGTEGEGRATARAITGACNLAFFWLADHRRLSLVAAELALARIENELPVQYPRLRGKARDWNWHNVIGFWSSIGARRSHVNGGGHVLSVGQRSTVHTDRQRTAFATPRPKCTCGSKTQRRAATRDEEPRARR